jgi:murein DD-endopeptidase MepM/ murein hydrolase activator NlpD
MGKDGNWIRSALAALAIATIAEGFAERTAVAQLGGFGCPMDGSPQVRQGDSVAKSGGRFDSERGGGKKHGALDLNGTLGAPVNASLGGVAAVARLNWGDMGHTVIIDHGSGAYTVYGHLRMLAVKENARVKKGDKIGEVGYSGNAAGLQKASLPPHLHFALIQAGQSGLAAEGKPLRRMQQWADYWQDLGAGLTGAVNPVLFVSADLKCWTGSPNVGP